jgi:hypothetical protein
VLVPRHCSRIGWSRRRLKSRSHPTRPALDSR